MEDMIISTFQKVLSFMHGVVVWKDITLFQGLTSFFIINSIYRIFKMKKEGRERDNAE